MIRISVCNDLIHKWDTTTSLLVMQAISLGIAAFRLMGPRFPKLAPCTVSNGLCADPWAWMKGSRIDGDARIDHGRIVVTRRNKKSSLIG